MSDGLPLYITAHEFSPEVRRIATPTSPAPGADFTITVPGDQAWSVLAINATLTTSAAVANRYPVLQFSDQTTVALRAGPSQVQAASLAFTYCASAGLSPMGEAASGFVDISLPDNLYLDGGWQIVSSTSGIQAADQWSALSVWLIQGKMGTPMLDEMRRLLTNAYRDGALALTEG